LKQFSGKLEINTANLAITA